MAVRCELDPEKYCDFCGECDRCDLDPQKVCDNCMECVDKAGAKFRKLDLGRVRIIPPQTPGD